MKNTILMKLWPLLSVIAAMMTLAWSKGPCYVQDNTTCATDTVCTLVKCDVNECHFSAVLGTVQPGYRDIVRQVNPPHPGAMTDKFQRPKCEWTCVGKCPVCHEDISRTKTGAHQQEAGNAECPLHLE